MPWEIDVAAVRGRQRRLLEVMQRQGLDAVVVSHRNQVQWLTGLYYGHTFEPAAALLASGHTIAVIPGRKMPEVKSVDETHGYEAQSHSTLRNDQRQRSSAILLEALQAHGSLKRVGVEFSQFSLHLSQKLSAELSDIEPSLFELRRRKDADELAAIKRAIAATAAMYVRAREIIKPGVSELEVFNALQATAVESLGEMLTGTGNDYQCGARGGPPRQGRVAADGELYILDLGPAYRGYYADNCRAVAVNRRPTPAQLDAWKRIVEVLDMVRQEVRPGVRCRAIFDRAQQMLDRAKPTAVFDHHLGHGIGLFPHEAPHLNPNWDDVFEVGDTFTAEPGLYGDELRAGIRLEENYHVTATGVDVLTSMIPLDL
jgi:Xaa-Pro dipeptidase